MQNYGLNEKIAIRNRGDAYGCFFSFIKNTPDYSIHIFLSELGVSLQVLVVLLIVNNNKNYYPPLHSRFNSKLLPLLSSKADNSFLSSIYTLK